ncbi:increased DNA methylation 1-like isoform X2 [Gastrolobium bilobum]|uniref:increased DNA methylation 1-like isoform X2 n=1 Tax=Gastrolobium bilobum TaxID=150636 RepID=UPI002AB137C0|nr:increased DNA methylation 1-like isoform X2 [Gastrolobium bilobum]
MICCPEISIFFVDINYMKCQAFSNNLTMAISSFAQEQKQPRKCKKARVHPRKCKNRLRDSSDDDDDDDDEWTPTKTLQPYAVPEQKQPRNCKKARVHPRKCKKRPRDSSDDDDDDDDDEWTPTKTLQPYAVPEQKQPRKCKNRLRDSSDDDDDDDDEWTPTKTLQPYAVPEQKQPRKCKKARVHPRKCKNRLRDSSDDDDDDDEWTPAKTLQPYAVPVQVHPRKCKKRLRDSSDDDDDDDEWAPTKTLQPYAVPEQKQPRKCKKARVHPRKCKKRKQVSDDEYSQPMSFVGGKRAGKVLRSSERVRNGDEAQSSGNQRTIISWLIDNNVVHSESKVFCYSRNNVVKNGRLLHCGRIACDCCGSVFSIAKFEAHADCTKHRPSASIFLEDGRSLLDCKREALSSQQKKNDVLMQSESGYEDRNNNICSICSYGGNLMLCDRCPSSFHLSCLGLEKVPDGDWFCPPCCCKICNRPSCREDCADNYPDNCFLFCYQCESKFHLGCANNNSFCSVDCGDIFSSLQKMIGKPIPVGEDNLTWTLLKTVKSDNCCEDLESLSQIESKLSMALSVFHECFDPIIDALTGRNIISDVIFSRSSEHKRLNFRGFYTVIMESNDHVVSAATIRIYGQKVAEIPFVATRKQFRRQGMCSILMNELEKQLCHLGIERMVLPSTDSAIETWTNSFGFARMTDSDKSQLLDYAFLDFHDTTMCHKPLMKTSM